MRFLLETIVFRCYVSFRECTISLRVWLYGALSFHSKFIPGPEVFHSSPLKSDRNPIGKACPSCFRGQTVQLPGRIQWDLLSMRLCTKTSSCCESIFFRWVGSTTGYGVHHKNRKLHGKIGPLKIDRYYCPLVMVRVSPTF